MSLSDRFREWLLQPIDRGPPSDPPKVAPAEPPIPVLTERAYIPASAWRIDPDRMRAQLEMHEGKRARIYVDTVGKVSGGIGRNLTDKGFRPDEIELMYRNDVEEAVAELDRVLPWWHQLDEVRRRVMVDLMFNMGAPTLMQFTNTLAHIQASRYREAAEGMLASKWAQQTGARARRLAAMMGSGRDWVL